MAKIKIVQTPAVALYSSISAVATSIKITPYPIDLLGNKLTMADWGSVGYCTIDPTVAGYEEICSFTGIVDNGDNTATLTGVTRDLPSTNTSTTPGSGKQHGANNVVVFSDNPQVYAKLGAVAEDEILTGYWQAPDPLSMQGLATKAFVLSVVNGGPVSFEKITVSGKAGETFSAGNVVYLKSDGLWWKAKANDNSTLINVQIGIAQGAGTAGNTIVGGVLTKGIDTNNTGTAGTNAYISDVGGAPSTSTGTYTKIIGQFLTSNGGLYFDPNLYMLYVSQGTYSSKNPMITKDNVFDADYDQSQTTQNGTIEVGMANSTSGKNKLYQSFFPLKTKDRGFKLYKATDTGSFTGTMTFDLMADSSGSPSGVSLATITLTNAQWLALAVGEFEVDFTTEYSSQIQGNRYWISISASTADNSNHPNLGTNTAGGYTGGTLKYWNIADGYVFVPIVQLYFKTLQGLKSQIVGTDTNGLIPSSMLDNSNIPFAGLPEWSFYNTSSGNSLAIDIHSNGNILYSDNTYVYIGIKNKYGNFDWARISVNTLTSWTYTGDASWFGNNIIIHFTYNGDNTYTGFRIIDTSGSVLYEYAGGLGINTGAFTNSDMKGVSSDGINGYVYLFTYYNTGPVKKVFKISVAGNTMSITNTYTITSSPSSYSAGTKPYYVAKYSNSNNILINNLVIDFVANTTKATIPTLYGYSSNILIGGYRGNIKYYTLADERRYYAGGTNSTYGINIRILSLPTDTSL